ncbi:Fic family protein [Aeromicrobium sp. Sec7.5]|uniref:Fic family protein n=1 Tax=Aeromicrobium sp. Sec7.5 TaxID=3121276 RepID=UPI002FE48252
MSLGDSDGIDWPAHRKRTVQWVSRNRNASRTDRELDEIEVSLPPLIEHLDHHADPRLAAEMESALAEIGTLDKVHGKNLGSLDSLLIRTESVASSKIEEIEADVDDYARALHGVKTNPSATSMANATFALTSMVNAAGRDNEILLDTILKAHQALLDSDPDEQTYAGKLRDMQNWIGGTSAYSPIAADYIPPPQDSVEGYMTDLVAYSNRDDVPVLTQLAIAHAQFESIHPFTDGNGRTGRALVNAILRRRGTTTNCVVPLASAIVAQRDRYFADLSAYRDGHVEPLLTTFTIGSKIAAEEASATAVRLAEIPDEWRGSLGRVRSGSATHRLLQLVHTSPVVSADDVEHRLQDVPESSVYRSIARLEDAGILAPLTNRKRNQIWGAQAVLDEVEDLSSRIAHRASQ